MIEPEALFDEALMHEAEVDLTDAYEGVDWRWTDEAADELAAEYAAAKVTAELEAQHAAWDEAAQIAASLAAVHLKPSFDCEPSSCEEMYQS